ncbi:MULTISPECIES: esterase-like activity of phytase family protein [Staphylococcus]|uniref:Esterase-like activity of phytase family protein n=1 Tax=Staphylococcus hsinchuensis TaxID=3051183 RepID=A0ABZ3ED08_9STAP|nr:esterase-like activity of phytase family protein [Staphylococcus sp. Marseille-Q6910]
MKKFNKVILTSIATVGTLGVLGTGSVAFASGMNAPAQSNGSQHQQSQDTRTVGSLKFLGSQSLPQNTTYKGTKVGGLSGITYNPKNNKWLAISDDRSEYNPARFYGLKLNYNQNGFKKVNFKDVETLKQPNGKNYVSKDKYDSKSDDTVVDPESIRFDPLNNNEILYTSEGDRTLGINPFIRKASLNGQYKSDIPVKDTVKMDDKEQKGFRNNQAIEGSTFSADGKTIWTALEGPLKQDDEEPTPEKGALSRITQYDRQGNVLSEVAYPLDPIPATPGKGKFALNGVTEMLAINDHQFLTLERASVQSADGVFHNYIRVYKIDVNQGTDVKNMASLKGQNVQPVKKECLLNLNDDNFKKIDNVEGITFGKKLPNGHDSIVLVADDNFNKEQQTQFLAYEVQPESK